MKRQKWLCLGLSLLLVLGSFSGCQDNTPDKTEPPESSETTTDQTAESTQPTEYQDPYPLQSKEPPQSFPVPEEGRLANQEGQIMVAVSSVHDGYYFGSQVLMFYDGATGETRVLCQNPGCAHEESGCTAWLGENTSMMEYQGVLYFTRTEDSGAQLCTKNPETGEIQVLTQWDHPQEGKTECSIQQVSHNMFLMFFSQSQLVEQDGIALREETSWEVLYDLDTRTERKIDWEQDDNFIGIQIFNRDHAVALAEVPDTEIPGKAYTELWLYSLADDSYTVISSQEKDGFQRSGDPCAFYGEQMALLEGDTLYVYDLNTLEKRKIITMANIRNYWIADGKVFFAVKDTPLGQSSPLLRLYYVDLAGGTPTRLKNNDETLSVYFRIIWEGASFFVGGVLDENFHSQQYIISKADYYTDNFAAASEMPTI